MIESLTYRGSYALIGVKDGTLEYFGAFGDMLVEYAGVGVTWIISQYIISAYTQIDIDYDCDM